MKSRVNQYLLESWFPRARGQPLELDLIPLLQGYTPEHDDIIPALASSSTQWQTLRTWLPLTFPSDTIRGRVPLLRKLEIGLPGPSYSFSPWASNPPWEPISGFADAPQLREVHLSGFTLPLIRLPWAQLTILNCHGQRDSDCVEILQYTPYLETFIVYTAGSSYFKGLGDLEVDSPESTSRAGLVRLDHLYTLEFSKMQQTLTLLNSLSFPALTRLTLSGVGSSFIPTLLAFIARSGCSLHSFSISAYYPISDSQGVKWLAALPTVTEVSLDHVAWPEEDFAAFVWRMTTDSDFLPNLQTLVLDECESNVPYGAVATMLASRWHGRRPGIARLRSFQLTLPVESSRYYGPPPEPSVLYALRVLVADGCRIRVPGL
ncbi:hypothetical protein C8F04DRAFT_242849 [Mycena alexandri]|uniref:Uncharacterized protein n=1 Tax=Mycena alexandri TaxID=1745969 RepID=A0AAD6WPL3_9AGAR|nr:hypothetical protein C8F04DRAFT_242849 [Mycena alexandri]